MEALAKFRPPEPWRRVIVDAGDTLEAVRAREGIGPDEKVIARIIVAPSGDREPGNGADASE